MKDSLRNKQTNKQTVFCIPKGTKSNVIWKEIDDVNVLYNRVEILSGLIFLTGKEALARVCSVLVLV